MEHDYLSLGSGPIDFGVRAGRKTRYNPDDPYGLGAFATNRQRESAQIRRGIKHTVKDAKRIKNEFSHGGWIGEYAYEKYKEHQAKKQLKNIKTFGQNIKNLRKQKK